MDYCPGGNLLQQLQRHKVFSEKIAQFYAAEILLGVEYLHNHLQIINRDLKLSNIVIDKRGHLKICDFVSKRTVSVCGTPQYYAPEMLINKGYDKQVDWWSYGCLLYEMLVGKPPYSSKNKDRDDLYYDIQTTEPEYPATLSSSAKSLLVKLLNKDPQQRIGLNGTSEIKDDPFFNGVQWESLLRREVLPPLPVHQTKIESSPMTVNFRPNDIQGINITGFTYVSPSVDTDDCISII